MKAWFKRMGGVSALVVGGVLSGCGHGITGLGLVTGHRLECDAASNVCGLSNTQQYSFAIQGHGTCGTIGVNWGDGFSQNRAGDFAATTSRTWIGMDHRYSRPSAGQMIHSWPGPKQVHAYSVANCVGEARFPFHLMHATKQSDGSIRHNAAFILAMGEKLGKPCNSLPDMVDLRIGSRVIIDELPSNSDMNFGCLFNGCINGPEGNAGPVNAAFPFPTMRRHSLVLRVVNPVAGQVQLVQGQAQRTEFVVNANGPLEFCVNDDALGDNTGGWGLAIQVDETAAR